jgi:2-polyprenyl-6-methoxyphenol hydroxylase-like FAD-dependent oxidoreductase
MPVDPRHDDARLDQLSPARRRAAAARLVQRRIVLLGDAVHATTPHLASGAGMAVESGIVLAEELARTPDVASGLRAYQERRLTVAAT